MAEIEIGPLNQRLGDDEIEDLHHSLERHGAPRLPKEADDSPMTIGDGLDDDALTEFLDRLEAHDLACEIYLPVEFEGRVEIADLRVGSATLLLDALEELKDELAIEADVDEDDDVEEDEDSILDAKLRVLWRLFYEGAQASIEKQMALHIQA